MNNKLILCLVLIIGISIGYKLKRPPQIPMPPAFMEEIELEPHEEPQSLTEEEFEELKDVLQTPQPKWTKWPKVRDVNNLGKILSDIESHMPAGHAYRDDNKVTWAHETTHGINANIRNKLYQMGKKINALYVLNDQAAVIDEPPTTIRAVAALVPKDLQGPSFDLYLNQQTRHWNDRPLYLFDEWTAYTNGSECGRELNAQGWYYELLQAHNFNVYCMYLAMEVKATCPNYDDQQFKAYIMWNVERTFRLSADYVRARPVLSAQVEPEYMQTLDLHYGRSKHVCPHPKAPDRGNYWNDERKVLVDLTQAADNDPTSLARAYIEKVKTKESAEGLRKFARSYFGEKWCKRTYGF